MATREQLLDALAQADKAEDAEGIEVLVGMIRELDAGASQPVSRSPDQAMRDVAASIGTPEYQGTLPDVSDPQAATAGGLGGLLFANEGRRIGAGQALANAGKNVLRGGAYLGRAMGGLVTPEQQEELNSYLSRNDAPVEALNEAGPATVQQGRMGAEAIMYAGIPGGVYGGLATRMGTGAVAGGLTAALSTAPGENAFQRFTIGALAGAAVPAVVAGVSGVVVKLAGRPIQVIGPDGKFTNDALEALQKSGMTPEQFDQEIAAVGRKSGVLTREQAERFNLFKSFDQNLEPTQAQLTRTRSDFVTQQQAAKTTNIVSGALDNQERVIYENVDNMIGSMGGRSVDSREAGNALAETVWGRINKADEAVGQVYAAVREAIPTEMVVKPSRLVSVLKQYSGDDNATVGLISAVNADLKRRGIQTTGRQVTAKISAETAEEIRKNINALVGENQFQRTRIGGILKEALDADVEAAVGADYFAPARAAKSALEKSLERARVTRRDVGTETFLQKLIENKVQKPENLVRDVMYTVSDRDVKQLLVFMQSGSADDIANGAAAMQDLRSSVLRELLAAANKSSGVTEQGIPVFSGVKFKKALDAMGNAKVQAIFTPEQTSYLGMLTRIGELKTPLPGTALGTGPTGLAVEVATEKAWQLADKTTLGFSRVIRELTQSIADVNTAKTMLDPSRGAQRAIQQSTTVRVNPFPGSVGAVTADRLQ